ncbi:MAG: class I SAM-dependent methyltransferase [Dehalococcoidia bacterium]|jgi:SAM-dependent methyltransferase|nr:class I SAM-dependent methyltransferase [Dehalococcoidia bacterium]
MAPQDFVASSNERAWDNLVASAQSFTVPWLHLDRDLLRRYAAGERPADATLRDGFYPWSLVTDIAGKDVLCLASGGGQQSAVFGLLDARVTVVDLSEGQLEGDREAAEHYGYSANTVKADMRDLSALPHEAFDLVYQAPSMGYVPEVRTVYRQVARLLRPGGTYRADAGDPAVQFADETWSDGYRIVRPFSERSNTRADGGVEFRHYLSDVFNGLLECGFEIRQVLEMPGHLEIGSDAEPGSWEHIPGHLPWILAVIAHKT